MVVIQEFVNDDEEEPSPSPGLSGGMTGSHKEVTHVEVSGENVS